jgi:NADPH:quinone reductase-like Zn-dependent oxidoreductase
MRALVADPSATPAVALADVPEPKPGDGELLLRMEAASVNRGEVRMAAAKPAGTVIGWDVVGTVIARGPGVDEVREGDRVLALSPAGGSFAEQVVVPAAWATPLPAGSDPVANSALPVAGLTAVNILRLTRTHAGDRVLVTGAAGGVGCLAVQLAVDAKCAVTGQVGSAERAGFVTGLGAKALVHAGDGAEVDGEFDVIVDGIGGPMFAPLLRALAFKGRMLVYGNSAGGESTFNVEDLYPKAITVQGFRIFQSVAPDQGSRDLGMLAELVANGRLKVNVQASAPLADGLGLLADLMDRKVTGKVVLTG